MQPFQSGTTPSNPGRWSNPDRPGLSWDFTFNPDTSNNGGTLTALWYGFGLAGDPVWYISNSVQYSNASTDWQAPLYRALQTAGGSSGIAETVGSMAVSFVPGQPEHMAVSWQLNSMTTPVTECVQRLGSDGNPNPNRTVQEVGPPYSGLWFAPTNSGWGYQALIDARPAQTGSAPEFRESNIVSLYDASGQPVWFATDSVGSNGQWSPTPPPLALTEMALKYVRATYDVTASQVSCASNCTVEVPISSGGVAKFWRSYSDPATGTVGVKVIGNYVNGANVRAISTTERRTDSLVCKPEADATHQHYCKPNQLSTQ